jgi:toxin ParE1/3/4
MGIYRRIVAQSSEDAATRYRELKCDMRSLAHTPNRCPVTTEDPGLRHLLYGNKPHIYRVIDRIAENREQVDILHIRHRARQSFRQDDLT